MIGSLKDQGLSINEISRRLGISRTTVRRHLKSGKVPRTTGILQAPRLIGTISLQSGYMKS